MIIKTDEIQGFKPFTISITFEKEEELSDFYHRINPAVQPIKDNLTLYGNPVLCKDSNIQIYRAISDKCINIEKYK